MQNKYLINFSKKFWFWFLDKINEWFSHLPILQGNYSRPIGILIDKHYEF